MKIYISGKITGLSLETARRNFDNVRILIEHMGYTPVNVMELVPYNPTWEWHEYMKESLGLLLRCDGIFMLSNWQESKGARVEHAIAKELGMKMFYERQTIE